MRKGQLDLVVQIFPTGLAHLDLALTGLIKHDLPGLGLGLASFFCSLLDPLPLDSHPVFRLQPTHLCHLGGHSWSCPDLFLLYRPGPSTLAPPTLGPCLHSLTSADPQRVS